MLVCRSMIAFVLLLFGSTAFAADEVLTCDDFMKATSCERITPGTKVFLTCCNQVATTQADGPSRSCRDTGVPSAMCGDASDRFQCDGYSQPYHFANNQLLRSVSIDLIHTKSDGKIETLSKVARISQARATLKQYRRVLQDFGKYIFAGTFQLNLKDDAHLRLQTAIEDIQGALAKSEVTGINAASVRFEARNFEIPFDARLYETCETKGRVALPISAKAAP